MGAYCLCRLILRFIESTEFPAPSPDIVPVLFSLPLRPWVFHFIFFHSAHVVLFVTFASRLTGSADYRMLREELGWSQQKSDELLLPVIQRINKRGAAAAANKQSNLDTYFGDSIGSVGGSAIPRKRQAYTSKRLQKVVTDYREEQRKRSRTNAKGDSSTLLDPDRSDQSAEELDANGDLPEEFGEDLDIDGSDDHGERAPGSGSVARTRKMPKPTAKAAAPSKRGTVVGEKRKARKPSKSTTSITSRSTKRKKRGNGSDEYDDEYDGEHDDADEVAPVPARPRPKPTRKKANTNADVGSKGADQERDGWGT